MSKSEKRLVSRALKEATAGKPVRFYVGSCPDYSHNGLIYTHKSLGGGVPFLTQVHLETDIPLLEILEKARIPYQYVVMIADIEAEDEVFCQRFTDGSREEFIRRCLASQQRTGELFSGTKLDGKLKSSSFFKEFGRDRFLYYQGKYQQILTQRYETDGSFKMRVLEDTQARMEMYTHMYPFIFTGKAGFGEKRDFLVDRTIRTIAQYLVLGRLIGEKSEECFPMIIVHPTRNKGVFNERNRFLLSEDGSQPQPTIPVFEIKRSVY